MLGETCTWSVRRTDWASRITRDTAPTSEVGRLRNLTLARNQPRYKAAAGAQCDLQCSLTRQGCALDSLGGGVAGIVAHEHRAVGALAEKFQIDVKSPRLRAVEDGDEPVVSFARREGSELADRARGKHHGFIPRAWQSLDQLDCRVFEKALRVGAVDEKR